MLHIDWTACDGRGLCVELLPELLDRDEWGYPLAVGSHAVGGHAVGGHAVDGRDVAVPASLRPHAERAVAHCPRLALKLLPTVPRERAGDSANGLRNA
jgi:ferredoxin